MIHATKATEKRLEDIIKKVEDSNRNYYTDTEMICCNLLKWIREANRVTKEYDEYMKYDSKESALNFWDKESVKYCAEGLYIDNKLDIYTADFYRLEAHHPDLIHFMHCADLQNCVIKDVNKLVKLIIAEQ